MRKIFVFLNSPEILDITDQRYQVVAWEVIAVPINQNGEEVIPFPC